MFHSTSVKLRLLVSIGSNVLRALISFTTGLLVARALNPVQYGDLMFLLGSFVTIRSLLDIGSSSAFFTFLSQRARGRRFYLLYFSWLTLQFSTTLTVLWLIIPSIFLEKIWLGQNREIVMLAFVAAFMQQQVWLMVGQIGEAMRKTIKVQFLNLVVALAYLIVISLVSIYDQWSVKKILITQVALYSIATIFSYLILRKDWEESQIPEKSISEIIGDYWVYCKPLVTLVLVSFAYEFADKWMLQRFGGSAQQGYFQISSQFAAISLLATTSILNVFWKEIANAWEKQDHPRVAMLYRKVSRGLVMLGAITTGFFIPWAESIVVVLLGPSYGDAWPVFAIMLIYPIHQSMGQIGGTMLLACGQMQKFMFASITLTLLAVPFSYLVLAPTTGVLIPGFGMGAIGIALKMVLLGIVAVNVQAWIIARYNGWKFDWIFQAVGIPLMIGLGYFAKQFVKIFWALDGAAVASFILPGLIAFVFYVISVMLALWQLPWLIGLDREEIISFIRGGLMNKLRIL